MSESSSARRDELFQDYELTFPLMLDDYDSYSEVDQMLLKTKTGFYLHKPAMIEVVEAPSYDYDHDDLVKDIIKLEPEYVVVRSNGEFDYLAWSRLANTPVKLRFQQIVSDASSPITNPPLPLSRFILDLSPLEPIHWQQSLQTAVASGVGELQIPIKLIVKLTDESLKSLGNLLDTVKITLPTLRYLAFAADVTYPSSPESYRQLAELAVEHGDSFYFLNHDYYRLARLHLYYRLPLLRLFIEPNGKVLPLPSCPLALGSLCEQSLPQLWARHRAGYWKQESVQERFASWYRWSEMVGATL